MKTRALCLFLSLCLLLVGCSEKAPTASTLPSGGNPAATGVPGAPADAEFSQAEEDMFTDRDKNPELSPEAAVTIRFDGTTVSCSGGAVTASDSGVTICAEGTYILSGAGTGSITVSAPEDAKIQLILQGLNLSCGSGAALNIQTADKIFLTLYPGTENVLTASAFSDGTDGAIFSRQDLTVNGQGSLTVSAPAGHGIVCKDDLVFTGGNIQITAGGHGLDVNDSVRITGTTLSLETGKDGIHAENADDAALGFVYISGGSITAVSAGDGISAGAFAQFEGGTVSVTAGGGSGNGEDHGSNMGGGPGGRPGQRTTDTASSESTKGIKAAGGLLFSAGTFTVDSADDAIHAGTELIVNGGNFTLKTGDDGFHSDENLTVTAGNIQITESYEGLEAQHIVITGGEISLIAADDGMNSAGGNDSSGAVGGDQFGRPGMGGGNGSITISGGVVKIQASGDGIDSNGSLAITGGYTLVCGPAEGDTAVLDFDSTATISGGTFIGTGSNMMAQSFTTVENQGILPVSVGSQAAGSTITVTDADGNVILEYTPALSYRILIFSSPQIVSGQSYTITASTVSGTVNAS